MPEPGGIPAEQAPKPQGVSRRVLFRKVGKFVRESPTLTGALIVGSALDAGYLINNEQKVMQEGIKTDVATFLPLYEDHDTGIEVSDVPENLDGFFREWPYKGWMDDEPVTVFNKKAGALLSTFGITEEPKLVKDNVLKKFRDEGTKIVLGDVLPSDDVLVEEFNFIAGRTAAVMAPSVYRKITDIIDNKRHGYPPASTLSRRRLIEKGLKAISAVSLGTFIAPVIPGIIARGYELIKGQGSNINQKDPAERVLWRLQGLLKHSNPDDQIVFFRSLMMANKMLAVAEKMKAETGQIPRIAFQVGAGHAGMEDFLKAGHEFTSNLIAQYPDWFLASAIDTNDGIDNFAMSRILTLPKDEGSAIEDEKYVDQKLADLLHKRFDDKEMVKIQREYAKRFQDFEPLFTIMESHLSPELRHSPIATSPTMDLEKFITNIFMLNDADYNQVVKSGITDIGDGQKLFEITINLPTGHTPFHLRKSEDLKASFIAKNGRYVSQEIEFYKNAQGQLMKNPQDARHVEVKGQEVLLERLHNDFGDMPKEGGKIDYSQAGPEEGQWTIFVDVDERPTRTRSYLASQDGHEKFRDSYQ